MPPSLLVIEDGDSTRELLRKTFTELGCQVTTVPTAEEGLALMVSGEKFDVLILDFHLPGMSGAQLFETMLKDDRLKKIPVVPFTSLLSDNFSHSSPTVEDWACFSASDFKSASLPIVRKPEGDGNLRNIPPELILSVAYGIRRSCDKLPAEFRAVYSVLVRTLFNAA